MLKHDVAQRFFDEVVRQAAGLGLLSDDHFTVDGTLIEAAASLKSFRPRDKPTSDEPPPADPGNPTVNFHGQKRSNATHQSTTDPEARLAKKGKGKEEQVAGSWQLASGDAPGMDSEEAELRRSSGTLMAVAQYAVLVVGLVMVLIGVLVMVANSHVT